MGVRDGADAPRLAWIDGLRGISAALVVLSHTICYAMPGGLRLMATRFNLGHAGVICFFLISGYVIPHSLSRARSFREFAIRRAFRVYPLYWLVTLACVACYRWGIFRAEIMDASAASGWPWMLRVDPAGTLAASLFLFACWVGYPLICGLGWTLAIEELFYALAALVRGLGLDRRPATLAALWGLQAWWGHSTTCYYLAILWAGWVARAWDRGDLPGRWALPAIAPTAMLTFPPPFWTLYVWQVPPPSLGNEAGAACGAALFATGLAMRRVRGAWPSPLLYLGRISYSVYLMHGLVQWTVPPVGGFWGSLALYGTLTLGLSALTYRWIERPAIEAGRRRAAGETAPLTRSAAASCRAGSAG